MARIIQDSVHTVAIEYHHKTAKKTMTRSPLESIIGIGVVKRKNLMAHFKGIEAIKNATKEEILSIKGINSRDYENIVDYFEKFL